ncbi:MAG: metallophosphoesterase family protein [Deltaproteobacteria bacterium]|nr:MAG: metallophosphoesterase family protein [Deltaproteobacteria bacterium]
MTQRSDQLPERVAIISDPHANLRGVELCYKKIKSLGIEQIFCCGDLVGYGHEPNQVVEFFREHDIPTISGNHDRLVCGQSEPEGWNPFALKKIDWTKSVLTEANVAYLSSLPINMLADDHCIAHGAWSDPDKYLYEERDFFTELEHLPATLIFYGHTHMPSVFQFLLAEGKCDYRHLMPSEPSDVFVKLPESRNLILVSFVNPGTVGYPRGMSGQATFVVWERETGRISYQFYSLLQNR